MSRPGIFDPYTPEPKKKKTRGSPLDMNSPIDTEYAEPRDISNISLDGDTYVVEFLDAKIEDIPRRLGELLVAVVKKHRDELDRFGVTLFPNTETPEYPPGMMLLPTPAGTVGVYVGSEANEVIAYRRLGYALARLSIAEILKTNRVKIYAR